MLSQGLGVYKSHCHVNEQAAVLPMYVHVLVLEGCVRILSTTYS